MTRNKIIEMFTVFLSFLVASYAFIWRFSIFSGAVIRDVYNLYFKIRVNQFGFHSSTASSYANDNAFGAFIVYFFVRFFIACILGLLFYSIAKKFLKSIDKEK